MAVIKKIIFSDNSNRVGIGTTTPNATLDVSGSAFVTGSISSTGDIYGNTVTAGTTYTTRITGAGAGAYIYFGVAGSNALGTIGRFGSLMQFDSDTPFSFKINGGEKVRIDSNGKLGIGTSSPADLLSIEGTDTGTTIGAGTVAIRLVNLNAGALGRLTEIHFGGRSQSAKPFAAISGVLVSDSLSEQSGDLSFSVKNVTTATNPIEAMRLFGNGNLFVGSSPADNGNKLDVQGGSLNVWSKSNSVAQFIGNAGTSQQVPAFGLFATNSDSSNAGLIIKTYNAGALTTALTVGSDLNATFAGNLTVSGTGYSSVAGRLGVGTTNPTAKLHVVSGAAYLRATIESESTPQAIISNGTQTINIGINGDLVPSINAQSNHGLGFGANNIVWATLTATGNLGIGTTTPYYGVDVYNGHVAFKNATSQTDQGSDAKSIGLGWASSAQQSVLSNLLTVDRVGNYSGDFKFYTRQLGGGALPAPLMMISGSGNVGIGTTSPNEKLEVGGNISIRNYSGTYGSLRFGTTNTLYLDSWAGIESDWESTGVNVGNLKFYTAYGSRSEKMRITSGGNVGIGITNPGYKLDVGGIIRSTGGIISSGQLGVSTGTFASYVTPGVYGNGGSNGNAIAILSNTSFANQGAWANIALNQVSSNANDITAGVHLTIGGWYQNSGLGIPVYIGYGYSYDSTPTMVVKPESAGGGGSVGIGTTSPSSKLHVKTIGTAGQNTDVLTLDNIPSSVSNGNGTGILFRSTLNDGVGTNSVNAGRIYTILTNGTLNAEYYDMSLQTMRAGTLTEGIRITGAGSVGIGITGPSTKLHVYGADQRMTISTSTDSASITIGQWDGSTNRIESATRKLFLTSYAGGVSLGVNGSENFHISTTGNVGIGTTSPTSLFTIQGSQSEIHVKHDATRAITVGNWDGTAQYIKSINLGIALTPLVIQASRFTFDTGNVGIGTTSPTQLLHVSGSVRINNGIYDSSNSIGTNGQVLTSTGTGLAWSSAGSGTISGTGTTNYVARFSSASNITTGSIYDDGKNIGIGTTSPVNQANYTTLCVNGATAAIIEAQVGGTRIGGIDSDGSAVYFGSIGSYPIVFRTAVNEKMRITSDGNVGIGTASPSYKLHVKSAGQAAAAVIESDQLDNVQLRFKGSSGERWAIGNNIALGGTGLNFDIYDLPNGVNRLRVDANGNVGIGTTSPTQKLDVTGNIAATNSGGNPNIRAVDGSIITKVQSQTVGDTTGAVGTESNHVLKLITNNTARLTIDTSGNVGIATTNPSYKLDVSGSVRTGDYTLYSSAGNNPKMFFSSSVGSSSIRLEVVPDGGLSFIGSNGQLFGISDNLSGSLMNVSDISGLPIFEVFSDDRVIAGKYGTNALVVTGSSVGIGTRAPDASLTISSSGNFATFYNSSNIKRLTINNSGELVFNTSYSLGLVWDTATLRFSGQNEGVQIIPYNTAYVGLSVKGNSGQTAALQYWKNNGGAVLSEVSANGSFGIGKSSPNATLDVSGSIIVTGSAAIRDSILVSATQDTANYYFKANANYNYGKAFSLEVRGGGASYGDIFTWADAVGLTLNSLTGSPLTFKTSNTTAITIDTSQNVNIGQTTPISNCRLSLLSGNSARFGMTDGTVTSNIWMTGSTFYISTETNHPMVFVTNANERMRISAGGSIGIGTTNPLNKFVVSNAGAGGIEFNSGLTFGGFSNVGYIASYDRSAGAFRDLVVEMDGSNYFVFKANGNIGIGKTTTNAKLDVNGNVIITGSLTVTSAITVTNLNVTTISSSVVYSSGSNVFGNTTSNKQQFTGSVQISGSLSVNDSIDSTDPFGLKTITKSLIVSSSWSDTGISGTDLSTGTYILQMYVDNQAVGGGHWNERYSGIMSWFEGGTNSTDYDEVVLHKAGHASNANWINLRTQRQGTPNNLKLQIISNVNTTGASNYIFKFRRMI